MRAAAATERCTATVATLPRPVSIARHERHEIAAQAGGPDDQADHRSSTLTALLVFVAPLVVLGAIALEIVAGEAAADPTSRSHAWVPLAWPSPLRAVYWVGIGAMAVGHRIGLARLGSAPRLPVTLAISAPFVVFAAGITVGAPWATWH